MNAVDAAIAELESRRNDLDVAIAALQRLDGRSELAAAAAPTPTRPSVPPPKGSRNVDADLDARLRALYEQGVAIKSISTQTGVKPQTIYGRAYKGKWKRPKTPPKPAGEKLAGRVRCTHCEQMTEYDPCEHCHKKLKRPW